MPEEDLAPGDAGGVRVLLAYFLGEGRGDGEQVRFALSADESLRKWRDLPAASPRRSVKVAFVTPSCCATLVGAGSCCSDQPPGLAPRRLEARGHEG